MNTRFLASSVVALAAMVAPATTHADEIRAAEAAAPAIVTTMDLSARSHDDWAFVLPLAPLDLSARSHDDWAFTFKSSQSALDLSPRSHDDWAVR